MFEYEAINALSRDTRLRQPGMAMIDVPGVPEGPLRRWFTNFLVNREGEDHARLHRLVRQAFRPDRADALRPLMRSIIERLLDDVLRQGEIDFVEDVSGRYPVAVMCATLGIDAGDVDRIAEWVDVMALTASYNLAQDLPAIDAAVGALWEHAEGVIARRRASAPRDDLLQTLIDAREGGDKLTEDELTGFVVSLLFAGQDTTKHQLGTLLALLAERPEQWERLAADRGLIPGAVEEALRYRPTVGFNLRLVIEDLTYRDVQLPAGSLVRLSLTAGGRDSAIYPDAQTFRIDRDAPNLAFGAGPHYCLGANMARAEMAEAPHALLDHNVRPELSGPVEYRSPVGLTGAARVPLRFLPMTPKG